MRIFFFRDSNPFRGKQKGGTSGKTTTYTYELIEHLARKNGHEVAPDIESADLIAVSLPSLYDFNVLQRARRAVGKTRPIVVGGHGSYAPYPLLAFADFVNVGQGFEFFRDCQSVADIGDRPYVITRTKREARISQHVEWGALPVVQVGAHSWVYWWSKGCQNKCNFCLTSWFNEYERNPNDRILRFIRKKIPTNAHLQLHTNDGHSDPAIRLAAQNMLVREYVENPPGFRNIGQVASGIEGITEERRRMFSKPLPDEMLRRFFRIVKAERKRSKLYLIAGMDTQEDWLRFVDLLDPDHDNQPSVTFIVNYFGAAIGTPFEDWDMTTTKVVDLEKVLRHWKFHNERIRLIHATAIKPYSSMVDVLMQRSDEESIHRTLKLRGRVYDRLDMSQFWQDVEKLGLLRLAQGHYEHPRLVYPYAEKKEQRKRWLRRRGYDIGPARKETDGTTWATTEADSVEGPRRQPRQTTAERQGTRAAG